MPAYGINEIDQILQRKETSSSLGKDNQVNPFGLAVRAVWAMENIWEGQN